MTSHRLRLILWVLVAIAAVGGILVALQPPSPNSRETGLATIGGPFTLTGSDAKPFPSSRLNGKPAAIFFGFTHCPDVCPTTLARLVKLRRQLGSGDDGMSIVFITVDPERDGPAEVGSYAGLFGAPVVGLTGKPDDIERVKKQYGVFSQKVDQPGGSYTVDHSASVFLMDRNGHFVATLSPEEGDAVALAKLKRLQA
ncbi:MAG TPA: SCO family protein [Sphingomicrobium sp.]|nr:SCO family protein [Sphingomicrobium sp.]